MYGLHFINKCIADTVTSSQEAAVSPSGGLFFRPENFLSSTEYMGKGMLAIFVTIAIIVIATLIINKIKDKS